MFPYHPKSRECQRMNLIGCPYYQDLEVKEDYTPEDSNTDKHSSVRCLLDECIFDSPLPDSSFPDHNPELLDILSPEEIDLLVS